MAFCPNLYVAYQRKSANVFDTLYSKKSAPKVAVLAAPIEKRLHFLAKGVKWLRNVELLAHICEQ